MTLNEERQAGADALSLWRALASRDPISDAVDQGFLAACFAAVRGSWQATFDAEILQEFARLTWTRDGFPTFRLTHGLAAALLLTALDAPMEHLHFPFDSFAVELPGPDPLMSVSIPSGDTLHQWEDHEAVQDAHARVVRSVTRITACTFASYSERHKPAVSQLFSTFMAPAQDVDFKTGVAVAASFTDEIRRKFPFPDRYLALNLNAGGGNQWYGFSMKLPDPATNLEGWLSTLRDLSDVNDGALMAAGRLVANLCLYLSRRDDGMAQEPSARLGKPLRQTPVKVGAQVVTPKTWLIGREIKLPHEFYTAAAAAVAENGRAPWKVKHRFVVRGHQRLQACGTGWKDHQAHLGEAVLEGPGRRARGAHADVRRPRRGGEGEPWKLIGITCGARGDVMPVVIKDWAVVFGGSPYDPPEIGIKLCGAVYGDPRRPDGDRIVTSRVRGAHGRTVKTENTTYLLEGPPEAGYARFCTEHGIALDLENPIKVHHGE